MNKSSFSRWPRCAAGLALAGMAAAWAQAAAPAGPASNVATQAAELGLEQRLDHARALMLERSEAGDSAGCEAAYTAALVDARQRWTLQSLRLWALRHACLQKAQWLHAPPTVAEIDAFWQPIHEHFERAPAGDVAGLRAGDRALLHGYLLRHYGHDQEADSREGQQVQRWLAQASADPTAEAGPARAAAVALEQLGQGYYGAMAFTTRMQALLQATSAALGPGHRATLAAMRSVIFNHRQLSRPAEAVALTERYAALVAQHHPQDERLAMNNRSERVGALSGVGRFADALDEGQALLDWLQRQTPRPYANLMRNAYNLAALCIEMADYDAAAAYAQLSADMGAQAPQASDRAEVFFARALREQARMLRGDPGAVQSLQAALQALPTTDLAVTDAFFTLTRQAQREGLTSTRQWARDAFGKLMVSYTNALQPERALPLLLDVGAAAPGDTQALADASRVLAQGLVGRDLPLAALSHFALARHVAPTHPEGAIWLYKRGAQVLRTLRTGLPEAALGVQKAWLAAYEDDLRQFIGLLIDSGRLAEAEQAIEVLREEELQDFRRRSRGASSASRSAEAPRREGMPALSFTPDEQRRNRLLQPVEAQMRKVAAAVSNRHDQRMNWQARIQASATDSEAESALTQASQSILQLARQGRGSAAEVDATDAVDAAPAHGGHLVQALPAGTARIRYFVRPSGIDAVVQTGARLQRVRLPVGAVEASRSVQALRAELQRPSADVPAAAQHLHRALLAPLQPLLQAARVHHLQVVPDGVLRYVPFAALHDGKNYVVHRFNVSVALGHVAPRTAPRPPPRPPGHIPEAAGTSPASGEARPRRNMPRLVAFGRTFGDSQHSALPGVAHELAALQTLRGAQVQHTLDAQFTAAALTRALTANPQVVHLASHFVLDAAGEEASYLLLGDSTRLPLRALRELPWAGVHLALLSACDSALALDGAGAASQGKELAGFAATLHAAGAHNVMATLWRIDDAATAQWMQAFYAPWRSGAGALAFTARHLAQTQRTWLRQHAGTAKAHPYYWAAFSWMGAPA